MLKTRFGFSLVELLIVIGIIAVLTALTFPVFARATRGAHQVVWMESARQVSLSSRLYVDDYDDRLMLPRQNPAANARATNDRTWVQSLMPYLGSFDSFLCPIDSTRPATTTLFDPDLKPTDPIDRYYNISQRSNLGYNHTYLAPMVKFGETWTVASRSISEIESPQDTIMLGDSAWEVVGGQAVGGGNYLISPPCRYVVQEGGAIEDTFLRPSDRSTELYRGGGDWSHKGELWSGPAGGLYPWFKPNLTIVSVDGTVRSMNPQRVIAGCQVLPNWTGYIVNVENYIWDLR